MSTVSPEPLALEVALAHYVASLPEGKSVALEELARELGCSVGELRRALQSVIEVEDRDLTTISGVLVEDGRLVKYLQGGFARDFRKPVRLSPVQGRAALLAGDFATSEYALRASSYPLHEGAGLPEQGPARMVEVSFAIEVGGSEVRGRIDAVFFDEDRTVHLIDWKTGRPHESYKSRLQLPLYALAANRLWNVEPGRMCLAYVFVPGAERVEIEVGEGFLGSAERRVAGAIETILFGAYGPDPSKHACSYCPVIGVGIEGCPTEVPEA